MTWACTDLWGGGDDEWELEKGGKMGKRDIDKMKENTEQQNSPAILDLVSDEVVLDPAQDPLLLPLVKVDPVLEDPRHAVVEETGTLYRRIL